MKEITLFGKCVKQQTLQFNEVNKLATKKGYIVHPDCCNERVLKFMETIPANINSTFYKTWCDVVSKDRFELFIDQVMHYSSTYGTDYAGQPYIPNGNPDIINFSDYNVILPITIDDIQQKIQSMFNSGIALKQETIEDCLSLVDEFLLSIDYNDVKNKEVKMFLCKKLDILPNKPEEFVRYLVYLYTEKTLLIKGPNTIFAIKSATSNKQVSELIKRFGIEKLAQVFHRYKPLLLAMKRGNETTINRLRKLANKYHKPYEHGYFEKILTEQVDLSELENKLETITNYKKVALLKAIKIRQTNVEIMPVTVRNGKIWVKEHKFNNKQYYSILYDLIYNSLIKSMSKKACKIKLNKNINLALPTSEKNFIGSIPFGSYVDLGDENVIIGINWRGADGASDLDLSMLDDEGCKIGWNSSYYNNEKTVVFSGDMTSANPEATELIYCENGFTDSLIHVNLYNGNINSKFNYFIAKTKEHYSVEKNHMVNPNDVIFQTRLEMISGAMVIGFNANNRFYFSNIRLGDNRVSNGSSITKNLINYSRQTTECQIDLKKVLLDSGFEITDTEPDIDLTIPDKSEIINLLL